MDQNNLQKETYFVAVKMFLEKDGKFLILKDNFGDWDLPGGRIKKDEFTTPLEEVVSRKIKEELGEAIQYRVEAKPEIFMRHERVEAVSGNPTARIFALGYRATLETGEIQLSPRHTELRWADPLSFDPESCFKGGWLMGVKEYLALKRGEGGAEVSR